MAVRRPTLRIKPQSNRLNIVDLTSILTLTKEIHILWKDNTNASFAQLKIGNTAYTLDQDGFALVPEKMLSGTAEIVSEDSKQTCTLTLNTSADTFVCP